MLLSRVSPGAYEILFNVVVEFLKQIPTVFKILTAAPTAVNQLLALVVVILGAKVLIGFYDWVKEFFIWLNEKL